MTTSQELFLAPILDGNVIPIEIRAYFQARFKTSLHQFLLSELEKQQKEHGLKRSEIARRIERTPSQVTRWLSAPTNLTLDTISDLLLAMGAEPDFFARRLVDQASKKTTPFLQLIEKPAKITVASDVSSSKRASQGSIGSDAIGICAGQDRHIDVPDQGTITIQPPIAA